MFCAAGAAAKTMSPRQASTQQLTTGAKPFRPIELKKYKILLLGPSEAGKTTIFRQLIKSLPFLFDLFSCDTVRDAA